jgi:hypothetical protein
LRKTHSASKEIVIPSRLAQFVVACPPQLPDEQREDYYALFEMMSDEIGPTSKLEWFALADIVDMLWRKCNSEPRERSAGEPGDNMSCLRGETSICRSRRNCLIVGRRVGDIATARLAANESPARHGNDGAAFR